MTQAAFLALFVVVALHRVGELVVSALRLRARREAVVSEPGLFPAMVALHTLAIFGPPLEVLLCDRPFLPWLAAPAALVLVAACSLRWWTLFTIRGAWNVKVVAPTDAQVVTTGPYAWIRHPNYLVVILELLTLPLLHTAWVSALALFALNGLVLARRIRTEEAALAQLPGWRAAFADRPRLIPSLRARG